MIRQILVATDFSTRSDRALRRAVLLSQQLGAKLSLVHVVDDDQPAHLVEAHARAASKVLEDSARTIQQFDRIAAAAILMKGDTYAGIHRAADEVEADLIVLGTHRRQLRDLFVGTTAERTIAHSHRPVLVAAGIPAAPYGRSLLALSLDEPSRSLLERTSHLGLHGASEIIAMHAFDAPARGMLQRALGADETVEHYVADEDMRASEALRRFLAGTASPTTRHRSLPVAGSPARTILACAREEDADLLVLGTSQRKGIERFFLGSVTADVLSAADRDVLVVPN